MSEPESGAPQPPVRPARTLGPGDVTPLEEPPPAGPGAPLLPSEAASKPAAPQPAPAPLPAPAPPAAVRPAKPPPAPKRGWLAERPETVIDVPRRRLAAQSRRDFLLFTAGVAAAAAGAWWLLPDRTRARIAPGRAFDVLDSMAARAGLARARRENLLDRALTFDDDVAEALYSKNRRVRTYERSETTPLRNNYNGRTPGPEYLPAWRLALSGLASRGTESLGIADLLGRFRLRQQVTRLVCVEGWSAVAWWGGIRFADFLAAFPPAPAARWAALRSAVNLDGAGRPDPYYVSIDLETARHPQTLLATHLDGRPLTVEHGAPLRLLVPMKLGLKNIKAVTEIGYTTGEPTDYWNERGYSKYDGLGAGVRAGGRRSSRVSGHSRGARRAVPGARSRERRLRPRRSRAVPRDATRPPPAGTRFYFSFESDFFASAKPGSIASDFSYSAAARSFLPCFS